MLKEALNALTQLKMLQCSLSHTAGTAKPLLLHVFGDLDLSYFSSLQPLSLRTSLLQEKPTVYSSPDKSPSRDADFTHALSAFWNLPHLLPGKLLLSP